MATRKKAESETPAPDQTALGPAQTEKTQPKSKIEKLQKKNKKRLPRKEKKRLMKKAGARRPKE